MGGKGNSNPERRRGTSSIFFVAGKTDYGEKVANARTPSKSHCTGARDSVLLN
jgi:hypothetical protein